jgi:hypothetical protein
MAQWLYQIHQKRLESGADLDEQLQKILGGYGEKGWELVQILRPQDSTDYHLVLKRQKPLYPTYG